MSREQQSKVENITFYCLRAIYIGKELESVGIDFWRKTGFIKDISELWNSTHLKVRGKLLSFEIQRIVLTYYINDVFS